MSLAGSARVLVWFLPAVVCLLSTRPAAADYFFTLNHANSQLSGAPGPYGTVDVTLLDSTHAKIVVTAGSAGGDYFTFGAHGTLGLNVNGTATVVGGFSSIVGTQPGVGTPSSGAGPYSDGGTGNVDGQGTFNLIVDSFDGAAHSSKTMTFTIQDTSGTWSSSANVLMPNSSGQSIVAHVFVWDNSGYSGSAIVTGYSGGVPTGTSTVVPEPSTLALALGGLSTLGLGGLWRRRKAAA